MAITETKAKCLAKRAASTAYTRLYDAITKIDEIPVCVVNDLYDEIDALLAKQRIEIDNIDLSS